MLDGLCQRWGGYKMSDFDNEDLVFMRVIDLLTVAGVIGDGPSREAEKEVAEEHALASFMETI